MAQLGKLEIPDGVEIIEIGLKCNKCKNGAGGFRSGKYSISTEHSKEGEEGHRPTEKISKPRALFCIHYDKAGPVTIVCRTCKRILCIDCGEKHNKAGHDCSRVEC